MLFGFVLVLSLQPLSIVKQCISRHRPIKQIAIIIPRATRSLISNLDINTTSQHTLHVCLKSEVGRSPYKSIEWTQRSKVDDFQSKPVVFSDIT